ncbi:MAG TPA: type II and III secretion system protein [Burkholderiales bacterium]|nr:type II and III secretion system protein [Burkholderiales bacterium]
MKREIRAAALLLPMAIAGCAQAPLEPSSGHIRTEAPKAEGQIPPPVQVSPMLPKPKPSARPETYSVVVSNVRVQELLFALARDARMQIDIDPTLTGSVTLNAIDQTLPQLLQRISRQVEMRYEIDGQNLMVSRDAPFLRSYKIDYLSASRNVKMQSTASTTFGTSGAQSGGGSNATGATSTIDVAAQNNLWESIVLNVKEILRETDKVLPAGSAVPGAAAPTPPPVPPAGAPAGAAVTAAVAPPPTATYIEAASVIANRESGILYVRATSKQHEKVQEFIDQVLIGAKRQVLIEATVTEVQLRNEYQRGIDWARLQSPGFSFGQPALTPSTSATPGFTGAAQLPFISFVSSGGSFTFNLKLLEQFGDVRVLSSPKLSVMNNQTATLRVTRDIIYFTVTPSTQPITFAGGGAGTNVVQASFTTTPNIAAEGFMMAVLPQINESDAIVLNVRPTIRRRVDSVRDPNPALQVSPTNPTAIPNEIPIFETREFDSILRLQSGQLGVLAGLMQDIAENTDAGIPGIRSIPLIGDIFSNKAQLSRKTELVIFLRATVIQEPSVDGDFRRFRDQVPAEDYFRKPNPGRVAPLLGPQGEPLL